MRSLSQESKAHLHLARAEPRHCSITTPMRELCSGRAPGRPSKQSFRSIPCTASSSTLSLSQASETYYLPMHGVLKESSTTTKLRVVFDASAKTTNSISLNGTLLVGPTLHPKLDHILLRFQTYLVAITGDISKMYREVQLTARPILAPVSVEKPSI